MNKTFSAYTFLLLLFVSLFFVSCDKPDVEEPKDNQEQTDNKGDNQGGEKDEGGDEGDGTNDEDENQGGDEGDGTNDGNEEYGINLEEYIIDGTPPNDEIWCRIISEDKNGKYRKCPTISNCYFSADADCVEIIDGDTLIIAKFSDYISKIGGISFSCNSDCERHYLFVALPSSVTEIVNSAFYNCTSLTSIEIPSGVTYIGWSAFNGCTNLTSVKIGEGVTAIHDSAFRNCTSLTSIEIPSSVTEIRSAAFYNCTNLTSIEIGEGVRTIGERAFEGCLGLKSMYLRSTTPPSLGSLVFSYCPAVFYVPMEAVEAYKNAEGWSKYASDRIVGYNFN